MLSSIPYSLPSIVALVAKIVLLWFVRPSSINQSATTVFLFLLFVLSVQNLAELYSFNYSGPMDVPINLVSGYWYFSAGAFCVGLICHLALIISSPRGFVSPLKLAGLYIPLIVINYLLWVHGTLIAGFAPNGFTFTRIPGQHYVIFSLYAVACLSVSLGSTILRLSNKNLTLRNKRNCQLFLLAISPTAVLIVFVLVSQQFGENFISTPFFLPICYTFFLFVMAYAIFDLRIFSLSLKVPDNIEKVSTTFHKSIQSYMGDVEKIVSPGEFVERLSSSLERPVALVSGSNTVESTSFAPPSRLRLEHLDSIHDVWSDNGSSLEFEAAELRQFRVGAVYPINREPGDLSDGWLVFFRKKIEDTTQRFDSTDIEDLMANLSDKYLEDLIAHKNEINHTQQHIDSVGSQISELEQRLKALEKENSKLRSRMGSTGNNDQK